MMGVQPYAADALAALLPEEVARVLDFSKLQIEPTEYRMRGLQERRADCVFTIPLKEEFKKKPDDVAKIRLILEHKAKITFRDKVRIILQVFHYFLCECEGEAGLLRRIAALEEDVERDEDELFEYDMYEDQEDEEDVVERLLLHPLVVVIYTGENRNLVDLKMSDVFYLPEPLKFLALNFPPIFINLPLLLDAGLSLTNPFVRAICRVLSAHSPEELIDFEETQTRGALLPCKNKDDLTDLEKMCVDMIMSSLARHLYSAGFNNVGGRLDRFAAPHKEPEMAYKMGILEETLKRLERKEGELNSKRQSFRRAVVRRFGNCPNDLADTVEGVRDPDAVEELVGDVYCVAQTLDDVYELVEGIRGA